MLRNEHLKEWARIVSYHLPHLSLPQVGGLATWSFGMVMTGSSSITRVSEFISRLNQEKSNTVRQRLKEWYQEADAKSGEKRSQLDVSQCFAPLLKWILSLWNSEEKWLPLAVDTTKIGQNFTVLSVHFLASWLWYSRGLENSQRHRKRVLETSLARAVSISQRCSSSRMAGNCLSR